MHDYGIFKVIERDRWTIIEPGDWANCLTITKDGFVVLVKQYRAGSERISLELPGGKVDPGEDPYEAACRELMEETGFSGVVYPLGTVRPNPAIMNNTMHYFVAKDASCVSKQNLDEGEEVDVILVPYSSLKKMVKSGEIHHALTLAALYLYEISLEK